MNTVHFVVAIEKITNPWHQMFHNSMLVKLATNFPKDGQRIAVIGTNKIVKLIVTRTKWPCRGTIQRTMAL